MIETLNELVNTAGIERMNLSIQKTSASRVAVAIQCILGAEPADSSDEQKGLRRALSQPILLEGITGEVDAKLDSLLTDYVRSVQPHAATLVTNVGKVKKEVHDAAKSVKSKQSSTPDDTESTANEQSAVEADDFATNEADSL